MASDPMPELCKCRLKPLEAILRRFGGVPLYFINEYFPMETMLCSIENYVII